MGILNLREEDSAVLSLVEVVVVLQPWFQMRHLHATRGGAVAPPLHYARVCPGLVLGHGTRHYRRIRRIIHSEEFLIEVGLNVAQNRAYSGFAILLSKFP